MAEGARLESVYAGDRIEGSNPSPSAIFLEATVSLQDGCRRKSQLLRGFATTTVHCTFFSKTAF